MNDLLKKILLILKRFPGGFKSPLSYLLLMFLWWAFRAFMRERGWWFKKSLKGQHIFLTGAGSGLGRRMAVQFALLGANLTISDIDEASVDQTQAIIVKKLEKSQVKGSKILSIRLDVSSRDEVRKVAQKAKHDIGDVDILINNAGIVQGKNFQDLDEFMIHKSMVVNVECHFWLIKEFIGPMIKKNKGHIVSIASVAGVCGSPNLVDYCASKFAAVGLMEALRLEFKRDNVDIKTTIICPFFINTGMFDGVPGSALFPLLDQDHVVWRTVNAVRQEEKHVVLPWMMGQLTYLAKMHPSSVHDFYGWLLLGLNQMKNFHGRAQ